MSRLEDYKDRYRDIRFVRRDGVLEMAIHRDGGPALWDFVEGGLHDQLGRAFRDVGDDAENRVVILTGTGDVFLTQMDYSALPRPFVMTPEFWNRIQREGKALLNNLLDIECPIIGAVNGPAFLHAELVVMSDIVIASDRAIVADKSHMTIGAVPGDGVHVWWPLVLGPNRGRYFLLTGQEIEAQEALNLGIVSEVVAHDALMDRAWALALELAKAPPLTLRYSRIAMTQDLKRRLLDDLGHGLALEGLAALAKRS